MTLLTSVETEVTETSTETSVDPAAAATPTEAAPATSETTSDWRQAIPEDLRNDPSLAAFKDPGQLAKSYVHAQKAIGADKIVIPGKYATEQDWDQFHNKLGRPESADGYEIEVKEGYDQDFLKGFKETAHKSGLRPEQVKGLLEWYDGFNGDLSESMKGEAEVNRQNQIVELKNEWGKAFDTKLQQARVLKEQYLPQDIQDHLDKMGYSEDPVIAKAFALLADKMLTEDERVHQPEGKQVMSPADAKAEINELMKNAAYHDVTHEKHGPIKKKMSLLYSQAYPD